MWTALHWAGLVWAVGSSIYVGATWAWKVERRSRPDAPALPSSFLLTRVGIIAATLSLIIAEDPAVGPWWFRLGALVVVPMALAFVLAGRRARSQPPAAASS